MEEQTVLDKIREKHNEKLALDTEMLEIALSKFTLPKDEQELQGLLDRVTHYVGMSKSIVEEMKEINILEKERAAEG